MATCIACAHPRRSHDAQTVGWADVAAEPAVAAEGGLPLPAPPPAAPPVAWDCWVPLVSVVRPNCRGDVGAGSYRKPVACACSRYQQHDVPDALRGATTAKFVLHVQAASAPMVRCRA